MTSEEPVRAVGKKKRGMKRLKGLITGKSRREKRKAKAAAAAAAGATATEENIVDNVPDDASTVYGAELDASVIGKSSSSASLSTAKSTIFADPVQVILLIMDPQTRRFELLQLEFDSAMAKVSDIYKQIPTAATEDVLQNATYKAIITPKGEELKQDASLSDYVTGASVVIAVPESSEETLEKCASMAVPILTNSKVHKMLISSGVKPEDLPEKPKKVKRSVVPPEPPVEEKTPEPEPEPLKPIEEKVTETPAPAAADPAPKKEKKSSNHFVIGILFAIFAHLFYKAHMNFSSPLAPGSTLSPGKSKSACGLLGFLPFYSCPELSMTMGTDGVLSVFDGGEVVFSLTGKVCGDEDDCTGGVVVSDNGSLLIGGELAKASMKALTAVTPWPFSEDVVYKKTGIRNII
mmetsp:Transcript_12467/g.15801  ORF Transcript_12467/g.15801 Transcript_12467/m.15801 type:complete len:407 (-) Transcript_12467:286-1506(-)